MTLKEASKLDNGTNVVIYSDSAKRWSARWLETGPLAPRRS